MPTDPSAPSPFERLLQQAEQAAEKDAAQVGLGLEARVMREVLAQSSGSLEDWGAGFFRAAFASAAVVLALTGWAWMASVYPALESAYTFSGLESHPVSTTLRIGW